MRYRSSRLWEPQSWPAEEFKVSFAPYFAEDPEDEAEMRQLDARSAESYKMVQVGRVSIQCSQSKLLSQTLRKPMVTAGLD